MRKGRREVVYHSGRFHIAEVNQITSLFFPNEHAQRPAYSSRSPPVGGLNGLESVLAVLPTTARPEAFHWPTRLCDGDVY